MDKEAMGTDSGTGLPPFSVCGTGNQLPSISFYPFALWVKQRGFGETPPVEKREIVFVYDG